MPGVGTTTLVMNEPAPVRQPRGVRRGTLTMLAGGDVGAVYPLGAEPMLVGRDPVAGVYVDDEAASRRHATIAVRNGSYELEDLGSTNGTYLDGERLQGAATLREGARIQIGRVIFRFAELDELERQTAKQMHEMSTRDGLTGAYNRRHLDERLRSELAYAVRHGEALCVLLIDIDHFKRINDTLGHAAGDKVLQHVGRVLQSGVRVEDIVARYGGEEFCVLARQLDVAGARAFAERVRAIIERTFVLVDGRRVEVSASIGVARYQAEHSAPTAEALLSAADAALYRAKESGRNRVMVAGETTVSHAAFRPRERRRPWERSTEKLADQLRVRAVEERGGGT